MWRLASSLVDRCVFVGKKLTFIGTIRATVQEIYVRGKRVTTGYISSKTKPIFRSESARVLLFIQMSREMWEFEEDGEIVFNKAIDGFLPELFLRWRKSNCHHQVSIILFTRVQYGDTAPRTSTQQQDFRDYYRVVVSSMISTDPSAILVQLKKEFGWFMRDALLEGGKGGVNSIPGRMSHAIHGNILEAINLAGHQYNKDYVDRDLTRTGISITVVTPGTGHFEVDENLLRITTENLTANGVSIDLLCLSKMPLHSVPLFKYKDSQANKWNFAMPHWLDVSYYSTSQGKFGEQKFKPRCKMYELQMMGIMESEISSITIPFLHDAAFHSASDSKDTSWMQDYDNSIFLPLEKWRKMVASTLNFEEKILAQADQEDALLLSTSFHEGPLGSFDTFMRPHLARHVGANNQPRTRDFKATPTIGSSTRIAPGTNISVGKPLVPKISGPNLPRSRSSSIASIFERNRMAATTKNNNSSQDHESNKVILPWQIISNPSFPARNDVSTRTRFRRWQHVFPQSNHSVNVKWKALCAPAALPLTTEYFPTYEKLQMEFEEYTYTISFDIDNTEMNRKELMRNMIGQRLDQGFQIIVDEENPKFLGEDVSDSIYMSQGDQIHHLSFDSNYSVVVKRYVRKVETIPPIEYDAMICSSLGKQFESRRNIFTVPDILSYNWNYIDQVLGGYEEGFTESMRYWRARFILLPVEIPRRQPQIHQSIQLSDDLDNEEIRVAGVNRLVSIFQKGQYLTAEEKEATQAKTQKEAPTTMTVLFTTTDPSAFVTQEYETLLYGSVFTRKPLLMNETESFRKDVKLSTLAKELQSSRGLKIEDRRWHLRLYEMCFVGTELVDWLVENFSDIPDRAQAIEYGQVLMQGGLFEHVSKRHQFLDGYYFYQFKLDFANPNKTPTKGWFSTKKVMHEKITSPTASNTGSGSNLLDSPRITGRSRSSSSTTNISGEPSLRSPTITQTRRPRIMLSHRIKFDVDHGKQSFRPEIVNLHYYRIYNPDQCYHIRLEWLQATSRLIEDTLSSWARIAERYGLRLVEVPIQESALIPVSNPFRAPARIVLADDPSSDTLGQQNNLKPMGPMEFRREVLHRFGYILDVEAMGNYPTKEVEVVWSWGRPSYRYSQYVHRSGVIFAQISDEGVICLLANRLIAARSFVSAKTKKSVSAESLADDLTEFCEDRQALKQFYEELITEPSTADTLKAVLRNQKAKSESQSAMDASESISSDMNNTRGDDIKES